MAHTASLHAGHRGTRAVQRLVEYAPSTGGLALWVHHHDLPDDAETTAACAPPVATDGHTLKYSPAFAALPLPEQAGWVAHEVLHIALRHPQRYLNLQALLGDVDLPLFNLCADAIVNSTLSHLAWLTLPRDAVHLDTLLESTLGRKLAPESALLEWDVERLYRAIDDRRPARGDGRSQHSAGTQGAERAGARQAQREDGPRAARARALAARTLPDLQPDAHTRPVPEADAEQAREWCERLLRAHAGDGGFSMLRTLGADLPRTRTPWQQLLRTQLARALTPRLDVSWSRPARSYIANQGRNAAGHRMPWEPGFSMARRVPRLAVVVDVSGSIDDTLMERFAREIDALTRRLEAGLVLVIGDDRVREVLHCEPGRSGLQDLVFAGGGGTNFTPLLEEADRHRPDISVVLTDLEGPAHFKPRWPVLWAVTEAYQHAVAPFGRVLVLR
ncbi:MAG: VWA-like domain-containing protein [Rubrivivax sp.]|nr:VWA-like domain-containing protein [Rubrivivax sp.]